MAGFSKLHSSNADCFDYIRSGPEYVTEYPPYENSTAVFVWDSGVVWVLADEKFYACIVD